ncbi:hypothetical protein JOL62DRAFT_569706 [Phyllosticta paracitricarpa]|uniref:Secreted protein n=1 Tax=Phyllosticta paracitricarpa TaxID=2016321 RepID=A0ABR1NC38_9PEZI
MKVFFQDIRHSQFKFILLLTLSWRCLCLAESGFEAPRPFSQSIKTYVACTSLASDSSTPSELNYGTVLNSSRTASLLTAHCSLVTCHSAPHLPVSATFEGQKQALQQAAVHHNKQ